MSTSDEARDMRAFAVQSFGEAPARLDFPARRR